MEGGQSNFLLKRLLYQLAQFLQSRVVPDLEGVVDPAGSHHINRHTVVGVDLKEEAYMIDVFAINGCYGGVVTQLFALF